MGNVDDYTASKVAAERIVLEANNTGRLAACILRPTAVFGVGDVLIVDSFLSQKDLFIIGSGEYFLDYVHVASVAAAHVLAERKLDGVARGRIYVIGSGRGMKYKNFNGSGTVGSHPGLSHWDAPHPKHIPVVVVLGLAALNEFLATWYGVVPLGMSLTRMAVLYTQRTWTFDVTRAQAELGFQPLSPEEAIHQIVEAHRRKQATPSLS
eukprot:NODE_4086_length_864_cov_30.434356_g3770_i0.p1 GENE.NODE_4086_length_864_cov_30.434356_g3770_i0~~NODE_4086_length_864_cov_30.434356_g3770_i0.p1  ORF type:complete len:209 (+),score=34.38 NODE_4086_length_864_cov_30.434356_g3770_i0:30-656(+)